ncbi:Phytochrome A-associated F-box protein [Platanthera zijinensis]|uniref:Phytochrome A-associated F-box protein n=1 Tax=Platanthera zijinensis TaxID=2320716 RepID=A0AAP0BXA4_9ASPA
MDTVPTKEITETSNPASAAPSAAAAAASSFIGGDRSLFSLLSDDVVLNIFAKLEPDPRDWARLSCVSLRIASLVRNICCRAKCFRSLPSGGWAALLKISVCCPGLLRAGILLENSDFGLEREIGPDENYLRRSPELPPPPASMAAATTASQPPPDCWSLFDDLYFDTIYDISETQTPIPAPARNVFDKMPLSACQDFSKKRKMDWSGPMNAHLASGTWNLSKEQGSRLLASRFKEDSLYISDWPGCIHTEEKRNYMLFRGLFKNFKRSRVWRTIIDSNRGKIKLNCAFCACKEIWDLHSAFCLKTVFGFHDDGEPVVRAYVCDNGHVSGAWTEGPAYS